MISVGFEVYGRVQGVFFRKYTQKEAMRLGIRGWCMNTSAGTVVGVLEGDPANVAQMKKWLETVGSPHSRIERVVYRDEKQIEDYTSPTFGIYF